MNKWKRLQDGAPLVLGVLLFLMILLGYLRSQYNAAFGS
jgi:hypothetical protein